MSPVWLLARRELRRSPRDFALFLLCLAIGVAALGLVDVIAARAERAIHTEASATLGGDVEITLINARATPEAVAFFHANGQVSLLVSLRAMARFHEDATLIELRGVDARYPLLGTVTLAGGHALPASIEPNSAAVAEQEVFDRLNATQGAAIEVGDARFTLEGTLAQEPDRGLATPSFGPHVITSLANLERSGLLAPGGLIYYHYRLRLPPARDEAAFERDLAARFPHAAWQVKNAVQSSRTVERVVARLHLFLRLVGLSALLIGGVGIKGAVQAYCDRRRGVIAILKAVGAEERSVLLAYGIVLGCMTVLGLLLGAGVAAAGATAILPALQAFLPVGETAFWSLWLPLWRAVAFGALTVILFSATALTEAAATRPARLFQARATTGRARAWGLQGAAFVALLLLLLAGARDKDILLGFVAMGMVALLVFGAAARMLAWLPSGLLGAGAWRFGLGNLARAGTQPLALLPAMGISVSVFVALFALDAAITRELRDELPRAAPSLFFIDIQPAEKEAFLARLHRAPGAPEIQAADMVRGRIARVKGRPTETLDIDENARWAIESDRGFSEAALPPPGMRLTAGRWWAQPYQGLPLVSLDQKLASGIGVQVGDSITLGITGREVTATVASLRDVRYASLRINFALLLSPGALAAFPATTIATARFLRPSDEALLVRDLAREFPTVSSIGVRAILRQLRQLLHHLIVALYAAAGAVAFAGASVLLASMAASFRLRLYDVMVLRLYGTSTRDLIVAFLIECAGLASIASLLAGGIGIKGAGLLAARLGLTAFVPPLWALPVAFAMLFSLLFASGAALAWRFSGTPPGRLLKTQ